MERHHTAEPKNLIGAALYWSRLAAAENHRAHRMAKVNAVAWAVVVVLELAHLGADAALWGWL